MTFPKFKRFFQFCREDDMDKFQYGIDLNTFCIQKNMKMKPSGNTRRLR